MIPDPIFKILNGILLPISRGDRPIVDFLDDFYTNYENKLHNIINQKKDRFLNDDFYRILESDILEKIIYVNKSILKVLKHHNSGDFYKKYELSNQIFNKVNEHLFNSRDNFEFCRIQGEFYRVRSGNKSYEKKDLFHVPISKREKIKNCRYSMSGVPNLYLGSTPFLCWFESGMPQNYSISSFQFKDGNENIKLLDLSDYPQKFQGNFETAYLNAKNDNEKILKLNRIMYDYLITVPIMVACSFSVKNHNENYIQEYTFPNILINWVKNNDDYDGIIYRPCLDIDDVQEWNHINIVLPTKQIKKNYCKKLSGQLLMSEPISKEYISRDYILKMKKIVTEFKIMLNRKLRIDKDVDFNLSLRELCNSLIFVLKEFELNDSLVSVYSIIFTIHNLALSIINQNNFIDKKLDSIKLFEKEIMPVIKEIKEYSLKFSDDEFTNEEIKF